MTRAFEPGDPALELAARGKGNDETVLEDDNQPWIRKAEQYRIDEVRTLMSQNPVSYYILSRQLFFGKHIYRLLLPFSGFCDGLNIFLQGAILTLKFVVDC